MIPHLRWPFRMGTGRSLATVEQDTIEDVKQNVHSYLHTERGARPLSPDFGLEDPTFSDGVDPATLAAEIEDAEERASIVVTAGPPTAQGRQSVNVSVGLAE